MKERASSSQKRFLPPSMYSTKYESMSGGGGGGGGYRGYIGVYRGYKGMEGSAWGAKG